MTAMYLVFSVLSGEGEPRHLAVHLLDARPAPLAERLRALMGAARAWSTAGADRGLRNDYADRPPDGAVVQPVAGYLYADGAVNAARVGRHLDQVRAHGRIHRFVLRPGMLVEGRDLVGREDTLRAVKERLRDGSCHLRAARRYGKTSITRRLESDELAAGSPCVRLDVADAGGAARFFVAVAAAALAAPLSRPAVAGVIELAAWPGIGTLPETLIDAEEALEGRIAANPWTFGRRLFEALAQGRVLVLLDEVGVFLRVLLTRRRAEAAPLLRLLRDLRAAPHSFRMLLAGSSGLSRFAAFHGLREELADLAPVDVPPLAEAAGLVLAEELIYGAGRLPTPGAAGAVLAEVGPPIPHFIHLLVDAAQRLPALGDRLDEEAVRRGYREGLLGPAGAQHFHEYELRSFPYPDALRAGAAGLLDALARRAAGVPRAELLAAFSAASPGAPEPSFEELLACLEEDYDLLERDGLWTMRCKVLRDRWRLYGRRTAVEA